MSKKIDINGCYRKIFELTGESHSVQEMLQKIADYTGIGIILTDIVGGILYKFVDETELTGQMMDSILEDAVISELAYQCVREYDVKVDDRVYVSENMPELLVGGRILVKGNLEGLCIIFSGETPQRPAVGEIHQLCDMICRAAEMILERTGTRIHNRLSTMRRVIGRSIFEQGEGLAFQTSELRTAAAACVKPLFVLAVLRAEIFDEVIAQRVGNALADEYENLFLNIKSPFVYVLFSGVQSPERIFRILERICECFSFHCGVSEPFADTLLFGKKKFMSTRSLEIGYRLEPNKVCYKEYDYYMQIVCSCAEERIGHSRYLEDELQRLKKDDKLKGTEFYHTLKQYLLMQCNVSAAARNLFIHRNTMIYRLGRITDLLKVDLADPVTAQRLLITIMLQEQETMREIEE